MNKFSLSVAFKGQLYKNDALSTNYVFPQTNTEWALLLGSDPRKLIADLNINGDYCCYTIKIVESGIVYAYRRVRPGRSGSNCAMVMLLAGGPARDGKKLTEKMHELLTYAMSLSSSEQIDKDFLGEKLSSCDDLFNWQRQPNFKENPEKVVLNEAFREYKTEEDLFRILENPYQPAYNNFSCIHIIPAEANTIPASNSNIQQITIGLEPIYFFAFPQGVEEESGKKYIGKSEAFKLIYKRNGYKPFSTDYMRAAGDSRYYSVDNDTIKVKTAEDARIKFSRSLFFYVSDERDNNIDKFLFRIKEISNNRWMQWLVGGRTYEWLPGKDGKMEVPLEDGQYEYHIKVEGYGEKKGQIDTLNNTNNIINVRLKAESDEQEMYLVPAFYKRDKNSNAGIGKVTVGYSKNNVFFKKYGKYFGKHVSKLPVFYVMHKNPKRIMYFTCILSLLIGFGMGLIIKSQSKIEENNTAPVDTTRNNGVKVTEVSEVIVGVDALESEDEKYLSENNVWEKSKLNSQKYKDFFDVFTYLAASGWSNNEWNVTKLDTLNEIDSCYSHINNQIWISIRKKIFEKDRNNCMEIRENIRKQMKVNRNFVDISKLESPNGTSSNTPRPEERSQELPIGTQTR